MLLTTYPVETFKDARMVLNGYTKRWRIDQFHLAWNSAGTDVESKQLEAADHRLRWSLILAAVAVALLRWQLLAQRGVTRRANRLHAIGKTGEIEGE